MNAHPPTLGNVLRALRSRKGWTLKEMGKRTDLSISTLSKVENDRLTLTYGKLQHISQRLNIPMAELFGQAAESSDPTVTGRRSIGLVADAVRANNRSYDYFHLCPDLRKKRMIPVLARIRAQTLAEFGEPIQHPGEKYIYVLEGAISVHTEFYEPVVLNAGQSIYLDSTMSHAYLAQACEEATVMMVCSSSDETLVNTLMSLHTGDGVVPSGTRSPEASGR
jgi:transcriptional regulator with XRE-family HTH domain